MKKRVPHRKTLILVGALVAFQFCVGGQAGFGWGNKCHYFMTLDAFHLLPHEIKALLSPYQESLLAGANEPDGVVYDPVKRTTRPTTRPTNLEGLSHIDVKRVEIEIEKLSLAIEKELRSPEKNLRQAATMMGHLSHFLADINQPFHVIDLLPPGTDDSRHGAFESLVDGDLFGRVRIAKNNLRSAHGLEINLIENGYRTRAHQIAILSASYFREVNIDYPKQAGNIWGLAFTVGELWNNAVKDILDYWVTIFERSGVLMSGTRMQEPLPTQPPLVPVDSSNAPTVPEQE